MRELKAVAVQLVRFGDTYPYRPDETLAVNLSRRVPREEMRLHVEMACDHGAESRAPDAYMNPKVIMSAGRY